MSFDFIGTPDSISRQNLSWGTGLVIVGLVLLMYALSKDKSRGLVIAGCLLLAAGGWLSYQSRQLGNTRGVWSISANQHILRWQSPNESLDQSFSVELGKIEHIIVESYNGLPESQNKYTLVKIDGMEIRLTTISGINLGELIRFLQSQDVQVKKVQHETAKI